MFKCNLRYKMADMELNDISKLMELSGLSRNSINKLLDNSKIHSLKIGTITRLCDTFNCKLSDLIDYIPEQK